jgi:hypothetical protein
MDVHTYLNTCCRFFKISETCARAVSKIGWAVWVAGLGERRRLAGTTSRSPSTTYVHSQNIGRNLASLELHYFPVTLFTHTNAAQGNVSELARAFPKRFRSNLNHPCPLWPPTKQFTMHTQ